MTLTTRQHQVVRLLEQGYRHREIARELGLAHDTVRNHVRNAEARLECRTQAQLVAKVIRLEA